MTQKTEIVLLVVIMLIATFFRVYQITQTPPGLYPDEAMDGNSGLQALANTNLFGQGAAPAGGQGPTLGWKVFYPENNGREGLYANIQALFFAILGPATPSATAVGNPWVLRLPSVIAGIATVLGLYFLGTELFSPEVGLLSSFLLAISFWHINFSRIGFRAILAPLFLTWALFFLIRAMKNGEHRKAVYCAIAGGIMYGLGFYTYIAYRISPLLLLLFVPYFRRQKKFWRSVIIFLAATFVVALPIGVYFLEHPADFTGRTSEISIFSGPSPLSAFLKNTAQTLAMFNIRGDGNQRHNYNGEPELAPLVGLVFVIGLVITLGTLSVRRKEPRSAFREIILPGDNTKFAWLILILWFILGILPVAISNEGIPHALRAILLIPPVMIMASIGGIWVYEFARSRMNPVRDREGSQRASVSNGMNHRMLNCIVVVILAYLTFQTYHTYFVLWAHDPNTADAFSANYVTIGREINALPASEPKYVVVQAGGVPVPITTPSGAVKEIPVPAQTVMFVTDTYTAAGQAAKNVHYLLPDETSRIPAGTPLQHIFTIE